MTFADNQVFLGSVSGETRTTCPECSHTRKKNSEKCLSVNVTEGVWNCHHCGWKGSLSNGNGNGNHSNVTYYYCDEQGKVLYKKIRAVPKADPAHWFDRKMKEIRRVPYRLPELIKSDQTIYVCEGEKDCDALFKRGLTATTSDNGAGNWKPELNKFFKGRNVVILEDNDEPGRKHGKIVAEGLHGIANRIKIIRFEQLPQGGDVSDYLAGHGRDDLIARQKEAPLFTGSYSEYFPRLS